MDTATFAIIITSLITFLYYIYTKKVTYNYWKNKKISSKSPIFPFGNIGSFFFRWKSFPNYSLDIYNYFKQNGCQYGGIWAFTTPVFVPVDKGIVDCILKTDFGYFEDRPISFDEKLDPLSEHLVFLKGESWRQLRRKVTPIFTSRRIKNMVEDIKKCCNELENTLNGLGGKYIDLHEILRKVTLDIIGSTVFGLNCNSLTSESSGFAKNCEIFTENALSNTTNALLGLFFPNLLKIFRVPLTDGRVTSFFTKVLKDTTQYRQQNAVKKDDFLEHYINLVQQNTIDFNQLVAQSLAFFIAGSETVSTTLTFCVLEIAQNVDVYDKVLKEIDELCNNNELTYEVVMKMKYMDMVLKETMRKYPTAPVLLRICTKDYKLPNSEVVIEKGTQVWIPIMGLQRDPEYYPDPDKFDPERFNPENTNNSRPFLTFGDGPRFCIGNRFSMLEMKLILISLLKKYKFEPVFGIGNIPNTIFEVRGISTTLKKNIRIMPKKL